MAAGSPDPSFYNRFCAVLLRSVITFCSILELAESLSSRLPPALLPIIRRAAVAPAKSTSGSAVAAALSSSSSSVSKQSTRSSSDPLKHAAYPLKIPAPSTVQAPSASLHIDPSHMSASAATSDHPCDSSVVSSSVMPAMMSFSEFASAAKSFSEFPSEAARQVTKGRSGRGVIRCLNHRDIILIRIMLFYSCN